MVNWNKWGVLFGLPTTVATIVGGCVSLVYLGEKIDNITTTVTSTENKLKVVDKRIQTNDVNNMNGFLWITAYSGWLERFAARGGKYIESDPPPHNSPTYVVPPDTDVRSSGSPDLSDLNPASLAPASVTPN